MLRTLALLVVVAACSRERAAHVRPLPKADGSPALRGGSSPKSPRNASYKIDAKLDAIHHTIAGSETLTWTNTGTSPVDTLPFHLYLNAFKNESSLFMRSSRGAMRGAKATQDGWGWIKVESIQLAGTELVGQLKPVPQDDAPADESVAELHLPAPVAAGATIELSLRFSEQLPEVFARTGFKGDFNLVGQWFPKIGVRTADGWECRPLSINTEFFADFGTYDVTLNVPSTEVVAATGVLTAAADGPSPGTHTLTYHAEDVHDFVWMADPFMEVMSGQAKLDDGTVEVRVYYRPEQRDFAKRHLEAGIGAIQHFSSRFVSYPWPIMSIIDPPPDATDGAGGMEYPTFVTTAGDTVYARPGMRLPEYVTVHEVGHNWFQGILASNEPVEAWMDEGVNEWADALVMADIYGPRTSGVDWLGWQAEIGALRRSVDPGGTGPMPSPIATAAWAFVDSEAYAGETYTGTMRALETLQAYVGPARFDAAMKAYAKQWAFKHPTGRDLFDSLSASLGDLSWFFGPAFHEIGGMQLELRSAECAPYHDPRGIFDEKGAHVLKSELQAPDTGGWTCEVIVTNTGSVHVPVDIDLKFADGSTERVRWDDKGHGAWERFVVKRSSKLVEVWLDPDGKIALDNPIDHHTRLEGDGSAALRAGAWFGSAALIVMQVLGP